MKFKYFEIKLFHGTTIVLLFPESMVARVLFKQIIGLKVFQNIVDFLWLVRIHDRKFAGEHTNNNFSKTCFSIKKTRFYITRKISDITISLIFLT